MGNSEAVTAAVKLRLEEEGRSVAWLARQLELPYKRVLAEVMKGRKLSLEVAAGATEVLGLDLAAVVRSERVAA